MITIKLSPDLEGVTAEIREDHRTFPFALKQKYVEDADKKENVILFTKEELMELKKILNEQF